MKQLLLFDSFPLDQPGPFVVASSVMRSDDAIGDLSGPPADKPLPRSLSRKEALSKFRALARAYRILGSCLLEDSKTLSPERRAELLSIMAIVKGMDDGS